MMRNLLFAVAGSLALLVFSPAADAQLCCGHAGYVITPCPTCSDYYNVLHCSAGDGNGDYAPVSVDCSSVGGCGRIYTYTYAGYCESASATDSRKIAQRSEARPTPKLVYRSGFVRNCKGEFVAVMFAAVKPPA